MSKSSIYEKIEEKGAAEVAVILENGQEKASLVEQEILQEATSRVDKLIAQADAKNDDLLKTKVTEIEQLAKQKILACKKELIKKTFDQACEKLLQLSDAEFTKLVIKLIKNGDVSGKEILVVSSVEYDRFVRLFTSNTQKDGLLVLDGLNKQLGEKYQLCLSTKKASFKGGFVIIGQNFDIDNSYQTILSDLAVSNETKVADMLFAK